WVTRTCGNTPGGNRTGWRLGFRRKAVGPEAKDPD
ncbi:MAG: hypothetical protein AVDCRST_MAG37-2151, partial [uncultured Rubrobacteraceae bacterium]